MLIRRRYAVAVAATIFAVVVYIAVTRIVNARRAAQTLSNVVAVTAAVQSLTLPADFVRLPDCTARLFYSCYRLPAPGARAARVIVLRMFSSLGVHRPRDLGCGGRATGHGNVVICGYTGVVDHEPILISLGPYFDCHGGPCRSTKHSEVVVQQP